jgi:hypothetical protein
MAVKSLKTSGIINQKKSNSVLAGYSPQDYELVESVFLAATTPSVTFSNLNQYATEYKHLQIRATARTSRAEINDAIFIRINGDTGSNYARHQLFGNGSTVSSIAAASETSTGNIGITGNTATANVFGSAVLDFIDAYSSTKNTTIRNLSGVPVNFNQAMFSSGLYNNTASITSITLFPIASFVSGSRFSLYGIR